MFFARSLTPILGTLLVICSDLCGQPVRAKPDSVDTPSWLESVLTSLAVGPIQAEVRGIDPGQLLPLARLEYPRLMLDPALPHPRLMDFSRVEGFRYQEPWQGYYRLIIAEADCWVNGGLDDPGMLEKNRAASVKALAAVYRMTGDRRYLTAAEQAFGAIASLPEVMSFQGGTAGIGWGDDLEMGWALLHYAAAFDATLDDLAPQVRAQTVAKFASACDRLMGRMTMIPPDNHAVVISAGVASMALVLAGEAETGKHTPQEWLDAAMSLQSYAIAAQVLPDGTYREGPDYARYSVSALLPYYQYVHRIYHRNLARHPRLNALFDWMIFTSNPDGSVSPTDDGWTEINLWEPLLIALARNPEVIWWSYERRQDLYVRYQPNMVDALAFASTLPRARPPGGPPSRIFPDGGAAVFRSGWGEDAFQMLLLGEPYSTFGGRHEQVDPGNLLIQKGSHPLLVDAGYGPGGTDDPDYEGYRHPGSHNMILMDGRGPEKNPLLGGDPGGSMRGVFDGPLVGGCRVDMQYGLQQVVRRILVPGHSYVLLEDQAPGNSDANMVSLFQAPSDVIPATQGGYRWDNGDASLSLIPLAAVSAPEVSAISRSYHSYQPSHRQLHQRVEMTWANPEQAAFLLIPDDQIRVTPIAVSGSPQAAGWILEGIEQGAYSNGYFPVASSGGRFEDMIMVGDGSEIAAGGVVTDAARIWLRRDASGDIVALSFRDATYLDQLGITIEVSRRISGTMWQDRIRWSGYVESCDDSVIIRISGMGDPGMVRFRGFVLPYNYQSGVVTIAIDGEGSLEFGSGPPGIWVPERRLEEPSFLQEAAWLPDPNTRFRLMSPRDQARLEGEILSNLRYGATGTLNPWMQDRWGVEGGGEALVDYMLGMADAMTSSTQAADFRIPHRTRIRRQIASKVVSLEGEGFWGDQNLRRFGGSIASPEGAYLEYREERPFRSIIRRSLGIGTNDGYQAGVRFEDGPAGDLWGGSIGMTRQNVQYRTGLQWGTGDLHDWRSGEFGAAGTRWAAYVTGGQTTDEQSLLMDFQHWLRELSLGYRYEYLTRGEYRGTVRANRSWQRITTGGSWEWTGGNIESTHVIRNMTHWGNGPWSVYSGMVAQIPDSMDVVASGAYSRRPITIQSTLHGTSVSPTVIPDRQLRIAFDAVDWMTMDVSGEVTGESQRSLESILTVRPGHIVSIYAQSDWDRYHAGPSLVGGGYSVHYSVSLGGSLWRQWYPIRQDGLWVSFSTESLPPVSPAGYLEIRWDASGAVQDVVLRVESRFGDIGPGILYLEEPGVDRRFEGYFRMTF